MKLTTKQRSARMKQVWAAKKARQAEAQKVLIQEMADEMSGVSSLMRGGIPAHDLVSHPPHYTFGKYEVIDVLQDWFPTNPLLWQVGKYIARAERKGKQLEDLQKAKFYLEREIARLDK